MKPKYFLVLLGIILVLLFILGERYLRYHRQKEFLHSLVGADVVANKIYSHNNEGLFRNEGFSLSILEIDKDDATYFIENLRSRKGPFPMADIINKNWVRVAWKSTPMLTEDNVTFSMAKEGVALEKLPNSAALTLYLEKCLGQRGNYYAGQYLPMQSSNRSSHTALYVYVPKDRKLLIIYYLSS